MPSKKRPKPLEAEQPPPQLPRKKQAKQKTSQPSSSSSAPPTFAHRLLAKKPPSSNENSKNKTSASVAPTKGGTSATTQAVRKSGKKPSSPLAGSAEKKERKLTHYEEYHYEAYDDYSFVKGSIAQNVLEKIGRKEGKDYLIVEDPFDPALKQQREDEESNGNGDGSSSRILNSQVLPKIVYRKQVSAQPSVSLPYPSDRIVRIVSGPYQGLTGAVVGRVDGHSVLLRLTAQGDQICTVLDTHLQEIKRKPAPLRLSALCENSDQDDEDTREMQNLFLRMVQKYDKRGPRA